MKIQRLIVLIGLLSFMSGCYLPISGTVVDAETNQPIEGAVVLVEWTKTKGFGLTYTKSYKVAETTSNKEGKFSLPGCYSPFVDVPDVTIYKKGYVAWSSRWIFPSHKNRTDFHWGTYIFRLDHFKPEYTHIDHSSFIDSSINISLGGEGKKNILKEIRWEELEASKERTKRDATRKLQ